MNNINNNNCNNLKTKTFALPYPPTSESARLSTYSRYTFSLFNKEIPDVLHNYLFSFFSPYECARNCVVKRSWNQFLTPLKWPKNLTDYCSELVNEKILKLGEMGKFLPVIQFLEKRAIAHINHESHVKAKNPELANDISASDKIPNWFFKYGNLNFWITNCTDITIEERGKSESVVLKGETHKMLVALAVDGNCVFALRNDGLISQWNYQTKQLVNMIETAYYKREQRVLRGLGVPSFSDHDTKVLNDRFYVPYGFIVQNGIIIIFYNAYLNAPKAIEMKSLTDSRNYIMQISDFDWMFDMKISNGKLILRGRPKAAICDLKKEEGKVINFKKEGSPIDICIGETKIYAINNTLKIYDLKSTIKIKEIPFKNVLGIVKFSNLILGVRQPKQSFSQKVSYQIVILDLNKAKVIGLVDNVIEGFSKVFEINKKAFKKLVIILKKYATDTEQESTTVLEYLLSKVNQIWSFFQKK